MRGMSGRFWAAPVLPVWGWGLIVLLMLVLAAIVVALVLRLRRGEKDRLEKLNKTQRWTLEEFESQVMALLSQHGGQLSQVRIAAALGLPSDQVGERLLELEAEGSIERQWKVEEYTYSVRRKTG